MMKMAATSKCMNIFLLAILALMSMNAPAQATTVPPTQLVKQNMLAAQNTWEMENTGYYDFGYTKYSMMPYDGYPWLVKVRDGNVVDVLTKDGTPVLTTDFPTTLSGLFQTIQEAFSANAASIDVTYSDTYGYPTDIAIDYDARIADEELYVTISSYSKQTAYDVVDVQNALTSAKNLWDSYSIEEYTFDYIQDCMVCYSLNYPWTTEVFYDVATAQDSYGSPVDTISLSPIPHLFDVIQDALDTQAFNIQVTYDETLGFPTSIEIDYDARIADEEFRATIYSVRALNNPLAQFVVAQAKWASTGISAYTLTWEEGHMIAHMMAYPWVVDVQDHQVAKITDANQAEVASPPTLPTIENMFSIIRSALDTNAAIVDVTYSEMYGHPEHIFIDYDTMMYDEEKYITISNLVATL